MNSSPPITDLAISLIEVDPSNSPRERLDNDRIEEFRGILDQLPPVLVYCYRPGKYTLAAGFHRLSAHKAEKRDTIRAEVRKGTKREARIAGMLSDLKAARMLSRDERQRAIKTVVRESPDESLRTLAELCGCAHETIRRLRDSESAVTNVTPSEPPDFIETEPDDMQHDAPPVCRECGEELTGSRCLACEDHAEREARSNRPVDPIPPAGDDVQVVTDNQPPRAPKPARVEAAPPAPRVIPCPHCRGTGRVEE